LEGYRVIVWDLTGSESFRDPETWQMLEEMSIPATGPFSAAEMAAESFGVNIPKNGNFVSGLSGMVWVSSDESLAFEVIEQGRTSVPAYRLWDTRIKDEQRADPIKTYPEWKRRYPAKAY